MSTDLAFPVADAVLAQRLMDRLELVEKELAIHVRSRSTYVSEAASHLLEAGGKRFRPLLTLLAAECGPNPDAPEIITAACVVELTHVASLYHDDVMDEALVRRGVPSANAVWDNNVAILTGDLLFARSSELTASLGPEAVLIQSRSFAQLVEGQLLEGVPPEDGVDPVQHHLEVVDGKTGALIATSARYGAMFSGAAPEVVEALTSYAEIVGTAFQLSDDVLDIASDSEESGKTPGTDLREGVPTLPVLLVRRAARPEDARLLELLDTDLADDADLAECVALLRAHPALEEARAYIKQRIAVAKQALTAVPAGPVRDALDAFADTVAVRTR